MGLEFTELADHDVALAREIRAHTDSLPGAADIPYRDTVDSALATYEARRHACTARRMASPSMPPTSTRRARAPCWPTWTAGYRARCSPRRAGLPMPS